jgi:hypothetical protein
MTMTSSESKPAILDCRQPDCVTHLVSPTGLARCPACVGLTIYYSLHCAAQVWNWQGGACTEGRHSGAAGPDISPHQLQRGHQAATHADADHAGPRGCRHGPAQSSSSRAGLPKTLLVLFAFTNHHTVCLDLIMSSITLRWCCDSVAARTSASALETMPSLVSNEVCKAFVQAESPAGMSRLVAALQFSPHFSAAPGQ